MSSFKGTEVLTSSSSSPRIAQSMTKTSKVSCTVCRQRKVKCDMRKESCSGCLKAGVDCTYVPPLTTRRRKKKKASEEDILGRLKRYEEILTMNGLDFNGSTESGDQRHTVVMGRSGKNKELDNLGLRTGRLIVQEGMSKYVTYKLWTDLDDEVGERRSGGQNTKDTVPIPRSIIEPGSLIFPSGTNQDLRTLHPHPVQIFRLWQVFLENVNPLVKLFHAPSVQQLILAAAESLEVISKPVEALMFSIYSCATMSLSNEDCESITGEHKSTLLPKYQGAAQQALIAAKFLKTSDLMVLQALALYLISLRENCDPHTLWSLTGIAIRIAQRIGLHHDGATLYLPIFDIELRRRLWWQIIVLDSQVSKLSGSGRSILVSHSDIEAKIPLNVNDSDLNPGMLKLPKQHEMTTEMVFCLIKYEIGEFIHSKIKACNDGGWQKLNDTPAAPLADKEKAINELETRLQMKYLKYCDSLIPLHFLSLAMARAFLWTLRLAAHHPRQHSDRGASLSQAEKDATFANCVEMFESSILLQTAKIAPQFRWHVVIHLPLDSFVYLLCELRHRTERGLVDRAWHVVSEIFEKYPELSAEMGNSLFMAICSLTLTAWEAREVDLASSVRAGEKVRTPHFISMLRDQRRATESTQDTSGNIITEVSIQNQTQEDEIASGDRMSDIEEHVLSNQLPMDLNSMDWGNWNDWLQGNDLYGTNGNGYLFR